MTKSNAKPKDKSASKQKKSTSKGDFAVTKSKPVAAAESADFTATAARERSGSSSGDSGTPAAAKDPAEPLVDPPAASIATKDSASSVTDLTDDTGDSAAPASSTTTAITATSTASKGKKKMTFDEWKESQKTADVRYKHYLDYRHEPEVESAEVDPEPGSKNFFSDDQMLGKAPSDEELRDTTRRLSTIAVSPTQQPGGEDSNFGPSNASSTSEFRDLIGQSGRDGEVAKLPEVNGGASNSVSTKFTRSQLMSALLLAQKEDPSFAEAVRENLPIPRKKKILPTLVRVRDLLVYQLSLLPRPL